MTYVTSRFSKGERAKQVSLPILQWSHLRYADTPAELVAQGVSDTFEFYRDFISGRVPTFEQLRDAFAKVMESLEPESSVREGSSTLHRWVIPIGERGEYLNRRNVRKDRLQAEEALGNTVIEFVVSELPKENRTIWKAFCLRTLRGGLTIEDLREACVQFVG